MSKRVFYFLFFLGILVCWSLTWADENDFQWLTGPRSVNLAGSVAELKIGPHHVFAKPDEAARILGALGNPAPKGLAGLIMSRDQSEHWLLVFSYHPVGFVRDDDREHIDSKVLLAKIQDATDQANQMRKARGLGAMRVLGWIIAPQYDPRTHYLSWAVLGQDDAGTRSINYQVRILGREGFFSAVLVADPRDFDRIEPEVAFILRGFSFTSGREYGEFQQGDKIADTSLKTLVTGGKDVDQEPDQAEIPRKWLFLALIVVLSGVVVGVGALIFFRKKKH